MTDPAAIKFWLCVKQHAVRARWHLKTSAGVGSNKQIKQDRGKQSQTEPI